MVYESDFYTTRRSYTRPSVSSYTISTPRFYPVTDLPATRPTRAEQQYTYHYKNESASDSNNPYSRPQTYSSTVERTTRSGPGGEYNYSSESTTGGGPGGYSYSSTTSGRLPHGTNYRHYSYRY